MGTHNARIANQDQYDGNGGVGSEVMAGKKRKLDHGPSSANTGDEAGVHNNYHGRYDDSKVVNGGVVGGEGAYCKPDPG